MLLVCRVDTQVCCRELYASKIDETQIAERKAARFAEPLEQRQITLGDARLPPISQKETQNETRRSI
ncbi:MAG: hypothetical protein QMD04_11865 [Anaerolineales bacterium]|nr:hypothetical protein [Anaerolineales bacterium]